MSNSNSSQMNAPNSNRKRLNLTNISSNFVYYTPYNRGMMIPMILRPRTILDASSY